MKTDATRCKKCGGEFASIRVVIEGQEYHQGCSIMSHPPHTHEDYSRLSDKCEQLRAALERSTVAINDWLLMYATELCDPQRVKEASERIGQYGTLGYIAHVQEQNRAALSALTVGK